MDGWKEIFLPIPGDSGWPRGSVRTLPKPAGDYWKEAFMQAMVQQDARLITFGFADAGQQVGQEQKLREVARVVTALPEAALPLVAGTGMDKTVAVRAGPANGRYWILVANPGCWSVQGALTLNGARHVRRAWDDTVVHTRSDRNALIVPFELSPYGMEAFVVAPSTARASAVAPRTLGTTGTGHMRDMVENTFALLSDPAPYRVFSFEEVAYLIRTLRATENTMDRGDFISAWHGLNAPRFQTLLGKSAWQEYASSFHMTSERSTAFPRLNAPRLPSPLGIREALDPRRWENVPCSSDFKLLSMTTAPLGRTVAETRICAAHDGATLYLLMMCSDRRPSACQADAESARDLYFSRDDCADFYLVPATEAVSPAVYHFAMNPGDVRLAEKVVCGEGNRLDITWQSATNKGATWWAAVCAVPFASLGCGSPGPGTVWKANFRRRYRQFKIPEASWSQVRGSYYHVDSFGSLVFQ